MKQCSIKEHQEEFKYTLKERNSKFMILKNDYYEIIFPRKYVNDIQEVLMYSTKKLIENLAFFGEDSYDKIIRVSIFT